ncbi:MAG TPA: type II toxin-antitoxin system Phd/YefM family antitoxin [Actinobacteria bacterium]|nr:type II toxin-antitoxin system Phd/YefM family antitoxin [Actinomycetes bacterium]HEX21536.1 type II toxin-antitoxin system Phd/YefM family antitoxin [Actinomycetota bacterium]
MSRKWQLQEAKSKFSSLVKQAQRQGPQVVTKHGKEAVVVVSVDDYKKIIKPKTNLVEFFQASPLKGIELDVSRRKDLPRDIAI